MDRFRLPFLFIGVLLLSNSNSIYAQFSDVVNCADSAYCVPSVFGMPRSKAFQFEYEYAFQHGITAKSPYEFVGDQEGVVKNRHRFKADLKFPLYNKPQLKVALGFSYANEDYIFENSDGYAMFQGLNDKNLKSLGTSFYMIRAWQGKHFFIVRASADLNGDYSSGIVPRGNYLKWSVAPMFGYKKNDRVSMGGGLAWGYEFGAASIFPFFMYNNSVNSNWGIEAILPANVRVRMNFSDKTLLYHTIALKGANYTINVSEGPLESFGTVQLQTSEIRISSSLEREIHDFLWFNVEVGVRFDLKFDITQNVGFLPDALIEGNRAPALFVKTGIFLVPPRKFLE